MSYDDDDWKMPAHQRRNLLQKYQIDTECEADVQAQSYWIYSIQEDEDHWKNILKHEVKKEQDRRLIMIQMAIKTILNMPKRKHRMTENKSYAKSLDQYNAALVLLREEGYNITDILEGNA